MKKLLVCCGIMLLCSLGAQAQTVVYKDLKTGDIGYCHGPKAKDCAYRKCLDAGGKNPVQVYRSSSRGYGAIALGKSDKHGVVIGVSSGYDNAEGAKQKAIDECRKAGGSHAQVKEWWNDAGE